MPKNSAIANVGIDSTNVIEKSRQYAKKALGEKIASEINEKNPEFAISFCKFLKAGMIKITQPKNAEAKIKIRRRDDRIICSFFIWLKMFSKSSGGYSN